LKKPKNKVGREKGTLSLLTATYSNYKFYVSKHIKA